MRTTYNLIFITYIAVTTCMTISCKQTEVSEIEKIIVDEEFIQTKIIGHDSLSIKNFDNGTGTLFYFNDTLTIYVWRDSLRNIRAWFKDINGKRIEGAEIWETTGQVMGKLNYVNGVIDGPTKYYYEDGRVKSKGQFKNGYWWGEWKNYDEKGNLISITHYAIDRTKTTLKIKE